MSNHDHRPADPAVDETELTLAAEALTDDDDGRAIAGQLLSARVAERLSDAREAAAAG